MPQVTHLLNAQAETVRHYYLCHQHMLTDIQLLYTACGFAYTTPVAEAESADYSACTYMVNGLKVRYRQGRVTPTKTGLFVTLWKRIGNGPIQPFDMDDSNDLYVIAVTDGVHKGQFVFSKDVLLRHGVLTGNGKEGKRGIRIYPPWGGAGNRQAQKTQQWQQACYLPLDGGDAIDMVRLCQQLYNPYNIYGGAAVEQLPHL